MSYKEGCSPLLLYFVGFRPTGTSLRHSLELNGLQPVEFQGANYYISKMYPFCSHTRRPRILKLPLWAKPRDR